MLHRFLLFLIWCIEQVTQRQTEIRHYVFSIERIVNPCYMRLTVWRKDVNSLGAWIQDPYKASSGLQVKLNLILDLLSRIIRRNYLDSQIWCDRDHANGC